MVLPSTIVFVLHVSLNVDIELIIEIGSNELKILVFS